MSLRRDTFLWGLLVGVMVGLSAALVGLHVAHRHAETPLPLYGEVPAFEFVDHRTQPLRLDDLRGRVWVADFIFSRCGGQCPTMTEAMKTLQTEFASQLQLISFTVDPLWDTPERLAQYAARVEARDGWHFVTGPEALLHRLATEGFRLSAARASDDGAEPIAHSVRLSLVDRRGHIRGYYDGTDPAAREQLRRDIKRLLRERAS